MSLTGEQSKVVQTAATLYRDKEPKLLLVSAIAGSGKTHTLVSLAKELAPTTSLYLAYNKAIAVEAGNKFKGTTTECKTIHSLAYQTIVRQYGISVKPFTVRDIKEKIAYTSKAALVTILERFFLSNSLDIHLYLQDSKISENQKTLALTYYEKMLKGEIGSGHALYLKLYHMFLVNGEIPTPSYDLLMVDELGDITELTIEIFKLIKAKLKVGVGDSSQNIYSFTHTIDGFKQLKTQGTTLYLTKSFRVSSAIASKIERFCNSTFNKDIIFKGREIDPSEKSTSHAFIARNNSTLIKKMISLSEDNTPFNLTRPPSSIFALVLALATLMPNKPVFFPQYKWLEAIANTHDKIKYQAHVPNRLLDYIGKEYEEDIAIKGALSTIAKYGSSRLFSVYSLAKKHYESKDTYFYTLTTAHSSKGLEFSEVTIMNDLNEAVIKSKYLLLTEKDEDRINKLNEEFRLYYVASSRAMLHIHNAKFLV